MANQKACHDCGAAPGDLHDPGCDMEQCPRCGDQAITCGCIYEINGLDRTTLEDDHPDIYARGPTAAMYARWDAEWGPRRLPWTGEYPGKAQCREFGWYARLTPDRGWVQCDRDTPGAREDLTRLAWEAKWDQEQGRFVRRTGSTASRS